MLVKDVQEKEFWASLSTVAKLPYVRIDWDRWVDEDGDEKPKAAVPDMGNFDGMNFGGSGAPNFGDMDMSKFKMPEGAEDGCGCGDAHCEHDHAEHDSPKEGEPAAEEKKD